MRKNQRSWVLANRHRTSAYCKKYNGSDHGRDKRYRYKFGITLDDYEEMLISQNGVCAICRSSPGRRRLHVDHDHATGTVRGLLCTNCNVGIGNLDDSPDLLQAAIEYLNKFRKSGAQHGHLRPAATSSV